MARPWVIGRVNVNLGSAVDIGEYPTKAEAERALKVVKAQPHNQGPQYRFVIRRGLGGRSRTRSVRKKISQLANGKWRGTMLDEQGKPIEYQDFATLAAADRWKRDEMKGTHAGVATVKRYRITRGQHRLDRNNLNPRWLADRPAYPDGIWEVGYRALDPHAGEPWPSAFLAKYFRSEAAAQDCIREHSDGHARRRPVATTAARSAAARKGWVTRRRNERRR